MLWESSKNQFGRPIKKGRQNFRKFFENPPLPLRENPRSAPASKYGCAVSMIQLFNRLLVPSYIRYFLVSGVLSSGSKDNLFYVLLRDYGSKVAADVMFRMCRISAFFLMNRGFSVRLIVMIYKLDCQIINHIERQIMIELLHVSMFLLW